MPVHPCFADKMRLLDGITSFEEAFTDPDQTARVLEFMSGAEGPPPPSVDDPSSDRTARELCARAGAVVVGVDYRLAVGGNLATGAALRVRDEDAWTPAALVLFYAAMHPVVPPLSPGLAATVADLPDLLRFLPESFADLRRNYLGGPESLANGYSMPGLAVLEGLPPTLVVNAEYDDLRAWGEAFTAALALAGVDVRQVTAPGMLHAFLMLPDTVAPAAEARALPVEVVSAAQSLSVTVR